MRALLRFLLRKDIIHSEKSGWRSVYRLSNDCGILLFGNVAFVPIDHPAILVQQFLKGGSLFANPFAEVFPSCN